MEYILHILIIINIYIILSLSTNLLVGLANLLSLGQAALYGIGAYTTAFALLGLGLPLIPALLLSVLVTAGISFFLAYVSLRLEGDYFVLATLGFQIIVFSLLYNWVDVSRGPYGIPGIPSPKLLGFFELQGIRVYAIFSSLLAGISLFAFKYLIHSPFGRALKGMRDDPLAMLSLGKNIKRLKIEAFVISSAFIALAGFIYASYISYIDPTVFNLDEALFIITAVLIGGSGNIKGPVVGAIFVVLLPEILRFIGLPSDLAANFRLIIYGALLIILMRFRPQGLAGVYQFKN